MAFAVKNIDAQMLINKVAGLAKAARVFKVPTIITTVSAETFSGPIFSWLHDVFPGVRPIDRKLINAWDDKNFVTAVKRTGRNKLIFSGLWTELCATWPSLRWRRAMRPMSWQTLAAT